MKAIVFGSLNIDYVYRTPHFVQRGETLASASFQRYCGGKGLNQAIALSRAGMETQMAGAVGEEGIFLLEELRRAGVDPSLVQTVETPTGHAIIQNTPDGDNAILLYGGANRSITKARAREVLETAEPGDLLLLQNEINCMPEIMQLGRDLGLRIALNPSPMELPLIRELLPLADLLILNRVEASQLLGADSAPDEMLEQLDRAFPGKCLVLTLGASGSLLRKEGQTLRQSAFPVTPLDTTAAGDTFTGFFLAGLFEEGEPAFALRFAAAAAALAVTRSGAAPSIPTREETLRFLEENS